MDQTLIKSMHFNSLVIKIMLAILGIVGIQVLEPQGLTVAVFKVQMPVSTFEG